MVRLVFFCILILGNMRATDSWKTVKWHGIQVPYPAWASVTADNDTLVISADNIIFMMTEGLVHLDDWLPQSGLYKLMPARKETERIPGTIIEANGYRNNFLTHIRWFTLHGSIRSVSGLIFWRHIGTSRKIDTPIAAKWLDRVWEIFRPS